MASAPNSTRSPSRSTQSTRHWPWNAAMSFAVALTCSESDARDTSDNTKNHCADIASPIEAVLESYSARSDRTLDGSRPNAIHDLRCLSPAPRLARRPPLTDSGAEVRIGIDGSRLGWKSPRH